MKHAIVIDNGTRYMADLLDLLQDYKCSVVNFRKVSKTITEKVDLVVLSGGHGLSILWHEHEYRDELEFIKNHRGPMIGVCLGLQLIAHAHGAQLQKQRERTKGPNTIQMNDMGMGFFGSKAYTVYENHVYSVQDLPSPLLALATSTDGIEILKHQERPIYGVQFHPESNDHPDGKHIFDRILLDIRV